MSGTRRRIGLGRICGLLIAATIGVAGCNEPTPTGLGPGDGGDGGAVPGDLVLVEKGATPKNNDVVIAQVDGEWTMKYFVRDRNGVRLEPANRKYKSIRPKDSLEIGGVVRTVIRKL